ncbi:Endonuclease/exonuclease/phosphatase [Hyaloraphidium curvatum]|nr:Endonuclease/exonuclease/phosphatase [Hyaloraphidium curvatum]
MRRWLASPDASNEPEIPTFRAVTYNVLAETYWSRSPERDCLGPGTEYLFKPEQRMARIVDEIKGYDADLLFLQEVESDLFERVRGLGFPGVFNQRNRGEGLSLHWNPKTFSFVSAHCFSFRASQLPDFGFPAGALGTDFSSLPEVFAACRLVHLQTGQELLAACTHLHWNPRKPHLKAVQAHVLASSLARLRGDPSVPVLLGGDFNSLPHKFRPDAFDPVLAHPGQPSGAYSLLTGHPLPPEHHDHPARRGFGTLRGTLQPPLPFASAAKEFLGSEPALTIRSGDGFSGTLDYLFHSGLAVRGFLEMPYDVAVGSDPADERTIGVLPDAKFPSDHLAVGAVFAFSKEGETPAADGV